MSRRSACFGADVVGCSEGACCSQSFGNLRRSLSSSPTRPCSPSASAFFFTSHAVTIVPLCLSHSHGVGLAPRSTSLAKPALVVLLSR